MAHSNSLDLKGILNATKPSTPLSCYSKITCILENNEKYLKWKLTEFGRTLYITLIQLKLTMFKLS